MKRESRCETEGDLKYHFYPFRGRLALFKVKAAKDVIIILSDEKKEKPEAVTLTIGEQENTRTTIRYIDEEGERKFDKDKIPGRLSSEEYVPFFIRIDEDDSMLVGQGEGINFLNSKPFLNLKKPELLDLNYFGVSTGSGVTGSWIIDHTRYKQKVDKSALGDETDPESNPSIEEEPKQDPESPSTLALEPNAPIEGKRKRVPESPSTLLSQPNPPLVKKPKLNPESPSNETKKECLKPLNMCISFKQ